MGKGAFYLTVSLIISNVSVNLARAGEVSPTTPNNPDLPQLSKVANYGTGDSQTPAGAIGTTTAGSNAAATTAMSQPSNMGFRANLYSQLENAGNAVAKILSDKNSGKYNTSGMEAVMALAPALVNKDIKNPYDTGAGTAGTTAQPSPQPSNGAVDNASATNDSGSSSASIPAQNAIESPGVNVTDPLNAQDAAKYVVDFFAQTIPKQNPQGNSLLPVALCAPLIFCRNKY